MRKFMCGLIVGVILATGIVFAAEYNIYPNPYSIVVDGQKRNIEGYNINDYSYFKLRDIGDVTGFDVQFVNDTVMINTEKQNSNETTDNSYKPFYTYTIDGIMTSLLDDGNYYVADVSIREKYKDAYNGYLDRKENDIVDWEWDFEDVLTNIPHYPGRYNLIPVDYYNNVMLPEILARIK